MDDNIYIKTGSAGAERVDYLLDLLIVTLFRAVDKYGDNFRLYSEWEKAGKFDDLVLTYKDKHDVLHHHLLQAEHVIDEEKTISYGDLISGDKFNIVKYFNSFKEIEKNFNGKIKDLILLSNLALNENVLPFVDPIPFEHPLFHFQEKKKDGKEPVMHKLNSKFIKEYQYSKLRRIAKTLIDSCFKDIEMKATNNVFNDCHAILSKDVVNVTEGKFHSKFIDGEDLSVETRQFRDILLEELGIKNKAFLSAMTQAEWLRNKLMKFSSDFGNSSYKKKASIMWPIALISPDDVELFQTFCELFILASSQPNVEELLGHIRAEYKNRFSKLQVQLTTDFHQKKFRNWFRTVASAPLSSTFINDALKYIKNNEEELKFINETARNIQALSPLQLEFETIPYEDQIRRFLQQNESPILHIETNGIMKVSLMKLFLCLEKLQFPDYFFSPETELSKAIDLIEVFEGSQTFHILIIELQDTNKYKEVMEKLQNLIQTVKTKIKKVIVATKKGEVLSLNIPPFMTVEDATYFEHLTTTSRQQLLNRKITFQGTEIVIKSILSNGFPMKHQDIQSWGCLVNEIISINSNKDDIDLGYYINRTLHCKCPYFDISTIQKRLGDQHIVTCNRTDFNREVQFPPTRPVHLLEKLEGEWCWISSNSGVNDLLKQKNGARELVINDNDDNFLDSVKDTLIISDPAGNGKTTITSYLATELMKKNQLYWVTRLPSSKCSFTAEEIQLTAASDNIKYDLFLLEKLFEVSTPLERLIVEQYLQKEESQSKLIFIFDGFDELNPESRNVIIRALKYLKKKPNVKFIGISTRPQHQQQLEEELQSRTWTLQPFNKDNKITFLEKFWSSRGATEQCEKMREYAKSLIASISRSIRGFKFTEIPLQMRIIGEMYEKNTKKKVAGDVEKNVPFTPIDLFELYELFFKKKENIYLNDKLRINENAAQRSVKIKTFRKNHIKFALNVMLGSKLPLSEEDLEDCIGLGIIQKSENNQFNFIHRTFAEFLIAKYLLDANVSVTDKLEKGQLMRVLGDWSFSVVKIFMNSKINTEKMVKEFTKPENETVLGDIERHVFLDAIEALLEDNFVKIFNFLFELLIFRIKRGTGLSSSIVKRNKRSDQYINIKTDIDVLLETFQHLLLLVLSKYKEELATCLIECQKRLEKMGIISNNEHLKSILWALNPKYDTDVLFSLEYFRYLKYNMSDLFCTFLKEKEIIPKIMRRRDEKFNEYEYRFYQLMEGESANFIFDHFVDGDVGALQGYDADQFETYFKFLSRYTKDFDGERLVKFQQFINELSDNFGDNLLRSEILLKFAKEHQDLFETDVIIQNIIFFHKELSLEENCALWGWSDLLKLPPSANASEMQSERRRILAFIRERHSDEQMMEIMRYKASYSIKGNIFDCQVLPNAIRTRDELNLEIFTSWITSEELFISFMNKSSMSDEVIKFVDIRFPQYIPQCFLTNEDDFVTTAAKSKIILEILGNDQKINEEEFWEIMNLKGHHGFTILYCVCSWYHYSLDQWLELLEKKCPNSNYFEQLLTILPNKTGELKIHVREKLSEFRVKMHYTINK